MYRSVHRLFVPLFVVSLSAWILMFTPGCPTAGGGEGEGEGEGEGDGFAAASAARGGALYDKWWNVTDVTAEEPTEDHPLWADRATDPDTGEPFNARGGADSWRCKECHGWDYKGAAGAYGEGNSHFTGFPGVFGTALLPQAVFDLLEDPDGHAFSGAGLTEADIWDLAKFVLEGQIDTDDIIDDSGAFNGDVSTGQTLYESGIGTGVACAVCHGADGMLPPPGAPADFEDFPGLIANENPWEFQHKVRFGQPGTAMPSSVAGGSTAQDVADLGAYTQTLPIGPSGVLKIDLASPGHWHVTRAKTLTFSVTDEDGAAVTGLQPTVVVKTLAESEESLQAADNGDGSYSADYTATDIGGGYAMAYSVSFSGEHSRVNYSDAWPVEVVRDGNEGIMPTIDGTLYAYQV
ncbi:MAG: c-type cytochrome, partial [Planctomycetota bacterium]